MPAFVALLRSINVGGHRAITMSDLCRAATMAGFGAPNTLLQSGNLVFDADVASAEAERRLEASLADAFGLATTVMVRTRAEWISLVAELPFPELATTDPSQLLAMLLRATPDASRRVALDAAITGRERANVRGATAYISYPDGIGRSKLTIARIEKALGTQATGRNWRTVLRIAAALG